MKYSVRFVPPERISNKKIAIAQSMNLYTDNQPLEAGTWYPVKQLENLQITWDAAPSQMYTLAVHDIDAPKKKHGGFLHLLVTNIPETHIEQGDILASWVIPAPLRGSGDHRYVVELFAQTRGVDEPLADKHRKNYSVADLADRFGLHLVNTQVLVVDPDIMQFYVRESDWQAVFNSAHPLIRGDAAITEGEAKYCSCVVHVAVKNPEQCNIDHSWPGESCYNPYAVCAHSVGTSYRGCDAVYNYDEFNATELHAVANLKGVAVDAKMSREMVLDRILGMVRK